MCHLLIKTESNPTSTSTEQFEGTQGTRNVTKATAEFNHSAQDDGQIHQSEGCPVLENQESGDR